MSYRNLPGVIITGQPSVSTRLLRPEYATDPYLVDGPLDATFAVPGGSVIYRDWGPDFAVQPYHQRQHYVIREHP